MEITGIIAKQREAACVKTVESMVAALRQETAGASRTYTDERWPVWLAWAHRDGASLDKSLLWNAAQDVCLLLSGQVFSGNDFLSAYERDGAEFIQHINGWFCGVLLDLRQGKVLLFNDRYGLQRLYYHESDSAFYFSLKAKSLLSALPATRQLDFRGVGELVSCGSVLQNRTLFSGISLLPPGSKWVFVPGQAVNKQSYFRSETWEHQPLLSEPQFCDRLKETFARALPRYLDNGESVAMSLTGGLDGRMIMAWAQRPPGTLPCYTFGGTYRDCADVRIAKRIARICSQPHQVIPVNGEYLRNFPDLARRAVYVSDGAMDVTGSAELYVNRVARQIAPVRLTGNYGSEILRGSVAFGPDTLNGGVFDTEFQTKIHAAAQTYAEEARCHPLTFIAFKQVPWHHYARYSLEQSELTPRSPYLDNELVSLMYQAPRQAVLSKEPSFRLIAEGNKALSRLPTDRGLRYPPVPMATRASNLYQEFTVRAEYAYDYGMPQWLVRLDRLASPLRLERLFLGRHKFCHFRTWYRDQLADYVREVLLDARSLARPYLQRAAVERVVSDHTAGRGNYTSEIHRLLSLELMHRELLERQ